MNENIGALFAGIGGLIYLALIVFMIACQWKIFTKAGRQGWECIIPIYNTLVMLKIVGKPWWWLILMMIPGVNIIFAIWALNMLSKSFGKSEGYTIGILLLPIIFLPMLAFGSAQYIGPYGNPEAMQKYQNGDKSVVTEGVV